MNARVLSEVGRKCNFTLSRN